jgi:hypothetical protein
MKEQYETIKVRASTARNLKIISALTGLSMIEVADSLFKGKLNELVQGGALEDQPSLQDKNRTDTQSGPVS